MWLTLICAIVSLILFIFSLVHPFIGLPSIFVIFLLISIELPNYISMLNKTIPDSSKLRSFSAVQTLNTSASLIAPALAGFVTAFYGSKIC